MLFLRSVLLSVLLGASISVAWAQPLSPNELAERLNQRYAGQEAALRPVPNRSPKVYVEAEGEPYYYIHDESLLAPRSRIIEGISFTDFKIVSPSGTANRRHFQLRGIPNRLDGTSRYLRVRYSHPHLGKGSLRIYGPDDSPPQSLQTIEPVLGYAFAAEGLPQPPLYIGDRETKTLYFAGVNHLPAPQNRVAFDSVDEAKAQGYSLSPLSFESRPRVSSWDEERRLGLRMAAELRYYYPLVVDPAYQKQLETVGRRVLRQWPVSLKGYTYRFGVIESDALNAYSCPGGTIYVTTGLLENIERESELEAILAHEITHAEKRHGYRQYRQAQVAATFSTVLTLGVAASTYENGESAAIAAGMTGLISGVASSLALLGYSREHEQESDLYTAIYLMQNGMDTRPIVQSLRKFQYDRDRNGIKGPQPTMLSTHPHLEERIHIMENAESRVFDPPLVWQGYDEAGNLAAQLRFEAQFLFTTPDDRRILSVLADLKTTSALGEEDSLTRVTLETGAGEIKLRNQEDYAIRPFDETGLTLEAEGREVTLLGEIESLEARLGSVDHWRLHHPAQHASSMQSINNAGL